MLRKFACTVQLDSLSIENRPFKTGELGSNGKSVRTAFCTASSATNDVVMFRSGRLNIFDTRLNIEIETPIAPSSTEPGIQTVST